MNEQQLAIGTIVNANNGQVKVIRHIGGGGQGDVYEVEQNGKRKALKWYKDLGKEPKTFYENIAQNIKNGSPSKAFLWPEDITEWKNNTFGYLMPLVPEGYYEFSRYSNGSKQFDSWKAIIDASLEIISGFRILHNSGYSYQDINDGNFMIHKSGKVLIVDNDNVAPSGENLGIIGKPRYIAPEVVLNQKRPDSQTDRYSLALILFMMLCGGHPLEGQTGTPYLLTPGNSREIYGSKAVFVFDPDIKSNRPILGVQTNVITLWGLLPRYMKEMFIKAFSQDSLKKGGGYRVRELEWMKVLTRFRSDIVRCSCGNEVFTENAADAVCDECKRKIRFTNKIQLADYAIPAIPGSRIYRVQLGTVNADHALDPVAAVIANPNNPRMIGICNMGAESWNCKTSMGTSRELKSKEVAPIKSGIQVEVHDSKFEIK